MRKTPLTTRTLIVYGATLFLLACNNPNSTQSVEQGPVDIESAYFNLSKEAQAEVLGTQVKSQSEMRKELLAKADADGDGQLSEEEKAALRLQWKELKAEMKAELKAKLDKDQDGEVSDEEKKEGLEGMGQKIKAAIEAKHEEMRAAREAAKDKIKAACADARGQGAALQKPEDAGNADMEQCQAVAAEEREKLQAAMEAALAELKQEIEELKGMLETVQTQNASI
ncbi:MAG: hypothetical protein M3Q07_07030 [Pseudobdellovibrionaceae bacterium]|nr:hypothetical protein [Pseudobdellovibrionaceae bacterium]